MHNKWIIETLIGKKMNATIAFFKWFKLHNQTDESALYTTKCKV